MKKKYNQSNIFLVYLAIILVVMAGCTQYNPASPKNNNLSNANVPDSPDTQNTVSNVSSGEMFSENSFASKIEGSYYGVDEESGQGFVLSIVNVYGNIYGICGMTSAEDEEPYSFWNMEIIPVMPEDLYDENVDELSIGVYEFSIMSNIGRYFENAKLGSIKLEDGGIYVSGDKGNPFYTGDSGIHFQKNKNVYANFNEDLSGEILFESRKPEEKLCAVWRQVKSDDPWYMVIEEGEEGKDYGNITIYKKTPGLEAKLSKGICCEDNDLTNDKLSVYLHSFNMYDSEMDLKYDVTSDNLTLSSEGLDYIFDDDVLNGVMAFEKIDPNEIPMGILLHPDMLPGVKESLGVSVEGPDGSIRNLNPSFMTLDDVENNGTDFVRVGNVVYFRCYDESKINDFTSLFANFTEVQTQCAAGCVGYYDLTSGSCGIAYSDGCSGPLYYLDGKFYSERYEADDYSSRKCVMSCFPDGSGLREETETDAFSSILAMSDTNDCMAITDFNSGALYSYFGNAYPMYCDLDTNAGETVLGASYIDGNLYALTYNYSMGELQIREIEGDYDCFHLATIASDEYDYYGYPTLGQVIKDGDDVYLSIKWYDGTMSLYEGMMVIKINPGVENKYEIVFNEASDTTFVDPYFFLNADNEITLTDNNPEGEVKLSSISYGDLIDYESAFGATMIKEDFIKDYPFDDGEGQIVSIFQEAYEVGGKVFVVMADAAYKPEEDIGWQQAFEFKGYNITVFDKNNPDDEKELNPFGN